MDGWFLDRRGVFCGVRVGFGVGMVGVLGGWRGRVVGWLVVDIGGGM